MTLPTKRILGGRDLSLASTSRELRRSPPTQATGKCKNNLCSTSLHPKLTGAECLRSCPTHVRARKPTTLSGCAQSPPRHTHRDCVCRPRRTGIIVPHIAFKNRWFVPWTEALSQGLPNRSGGQQSVLQTNTAGKCT